MFGRSKVDPRAIAACAAVCAGALAYAQEAEPTKTPVDVITDVLDELSEIPQGIAGEIKDQVTEGELESDLGGLE